MVQFEIVRAEFWPIVNKVFLPLVSKNISLFLRSARSSALNIIPLTFSVTRSAAAPTLSETNTALAHAMASFTASPQVSPGPLDGKQNRSQDWYTTGISD